MRCRALRGSWRCRRWNWPCRAPATPDPTADPPSPRYATDACVPGRSAPCTAVGSAGGPATRLVWRDSQAALTVPDGGRQNPEPPGRIAFALLATDETGGVSV